MTGGPTPLVGGDRLDPGTRDLIQYRHGRGILDLGWGHPDPDLLPVAAWSRAWAGAARRWGSRLLTYGYGRGPLPFREWLGERLGAVDGVPVHPDDVVVTAGASHALDLLATAHTRPGDRVLVQSPTYHLALRILVDHGLTPVPMVPDDSGWGIDVAATRERIGGTRDLADRKGRISMIYVVGTYANPTGHSLGRRHGADLTRLAAELGAVLVEDDTYRELSLEGEAPNSIYSAEGNGSVARIGSLSKVLAPALRIGWITAPPEFLDPIAEGGLLDSGGGVSHSHSLVVAEFAAAGAFDPHVEVVRNAYRKRRDALVAGLRSHCPDLRFEVPEGGWFIWAEVSRECDTSRLVERAEGSGVALLPGSTFAPAGGERGLERRIRLAFSMLSPGELSEAAARLGRALTG